VTAGVRGTSFYEYTTGDFRSFSTRGGSRERSETDWSVDAVDFSDSTVKSCL